MASNSEPEYAIARLRRNQSLIHQYPQRFPDRPVTCAVLRSEHASARQLVTASPFTCGDALPQIGSYPLLRQENKVTGGLFGAVPIVAIITMAGIGHWVGHGHTLSRSGLDDGLYGLYRLSRSEPTATSQSVPSKHELGMKQVCRRHGDFGGTLYMDLIAIGQRLGLIPPFPAPRTAPDNCRDLIVPGIPGEPRVICVDAVLDGIAADPVALQEADWLDQLVAELLFSDELPEWLRIGSNPPSNGQGLDL